jgi:hypothetical protein
MYSRHFLQMPALSQRVPDAPLVASNTLSSLGTSPHAFEQVAPRFQLKRPREDDEDDDDTEEEEEEEEEDESVLRRVEVLEKQMRFIQRELSALKRVLEKGQVADSDKTSSKSPSGHFVEPSSKSTSTPVAHSTTSNPSRPKAFFAKGMTLDELREQYKGLSFQELRKRYKSLS